MTWKITKEGTRALRGDPGAPKITRPQRRTLEDIRDHADPAWRCRGMSMYGGLTAVLPVLRRLKLAEDIEP